MYEREEKGFVLTDVILQLLFFVLFIFALVWLFPTKGFINNMQGQLSTNNANYQILSSRIFNDNLLLMKEAAESYYTTPRLPKNTGDKVSMTLREMIDKKILLSFEDKDGNTCDAENSYVEITKRADEYELKIVLSCSDKEDYMIVHLGCYQYCENDVCEKTGTTTTVSTTNTSSQTTVVKPVIERPVINNNITINNCVNCGSESNKPSTPDKEEKYYCQYVNGKYYGKNGNVVSATTYQSECIQEEKYYCQYVNGKYYGKNGNVVSATTYQSECIQEEKYYCQYVNGKYYGKNGNVVSATTYQSECIQEEKYYCQYVNGKYYGKNGNVVSYATYEAECIQKSKTLYYEYQTKTLVANEVATRMCTYYPVTEESEYVYTLGYTGANVTDIARFPYGVKLPKGAANVKVSGISYGKETFNLSTWKNLKNSHSIYNYETNDSGYSAKDAITTTRFNNSALSKRHFSNVIVLNTKTVSYSNFVEYRIDYRILLNRSAILNDRTLKLYNDSNVGNIYYVPVRFYLTYDVIGSSTRTKPCSQLTSKELSQVTKRYTNYEIESKYEYGPKSWTLNPNLTGVEYTGRTEWR